MSPWEVIGWLIAIPMLIFTALFVYALVVALVRLSVKRRPETVSKDRHLRAVD